MKTALVTGGAGFLGSHLAEGLLKRDYRVTVIDNLSNGSMSNLSRLMAKEEFTFIRGDCTNESQVRRALKGVDVVFHLAANPEVRLERSDPDQCFVQNVVSTQVMLEQTRRSGADTFVLASSSTVYGEPETIPTPEDYSPLRPVSVYGGSKLAAEALVTSYCEMFEKRAVIVRLANIVGERNRHGIIADLFRKLQRDRRVLEVLGDGKQAKSYLHVQDCIPGILAALRASRRRVEVYNVGSGDCITVRRIAETIVEEMGLSTRLEFVRQAKGGRGWPGDVKRMQLEIGRLTSKGWAPKLNSEMAVRQVIRALKSTYKMPH